MNSRHEHDEPARTLAAFKPISVLLVAALLLCAPLALPVRAYLSTLVASLQQFGAGGLVCVALLYIPACVLLLPQGLFGKAEARKV